MRAVVVGDDVDGEISGCFSLDLLQEPQPLDMSGADIGTGKNLAVQIIEGCEKRDRAMPSVVVRLGADVADAERQSRLGSLQRLTLGLFVATEYQRLFRRVEIQTDDIPKLRLEVRIFGEFEGADKMRFEIVPLPDPLYRPMGNSGRAGHRSGAPSLPSLRRLGHFFDDLLNLLHRQKGAFGHGPACLPSLPGRSARIDATTMRLS